MEIRVPSDLLKTVAERWKAPRYNVETGEWFDSPLRKVGRAEGIYLQLLALDPITAEGVEEIIGNDSWTTLYCSECNGEGFDHVIVFEAWSGGDEVTLCRECFGKSVEMVLEFETSDEPELDAEDILKTVATLEPYQHVKVYTLEADPLTAPRPKFNASDVEAQFGDECDCGKGIYCPTYQVRHGLSDAAMMELYQAEESVEANFVDDLNLDEGSDRLMYYRQDMEAQGLDICGEPL